MNREEAKEFIRRNIVSLYEMEGNDVQITIEELNTIDNILREVYHRNTPSTNDHIPMAESQRKKISDARLGVPLSDATKERIRQDSQRINVYQYRLDGELIAVWKSTREAARILGINNSSISKCCRGKRNTAGGFIWKYKPLGEDDMRISVRIEKVIKNEQPVLIAERQYNS